MIGLARGPFLLPHGLPGAYSRVTSTHIFARPVAFLACLRERRGFLAELRERRGFLAENSLLGKFCLMAIFGWR